MIQSEMTKGKSKVSKKTASPVCVANIRREEVSWLWPAYIPKGMLTVIDGNPDLGKSFITTDIAARVTRGWMMPPCRSQEAVTQPGNVLILNAEDDPARTMRPRLESLHADLRRIHLMNSVPIAEGEIPMVFPAHLPVLEHAIAELKPSLVIIDPLMAFIGAEVDSHRDSDIRRLLSRIKWLAEQTQAAFLAVRHLNKMVNVGEALFRGGGSIGIIGAARSALLVAHHPEAPGVRVLARTKGNLSREPPALAYLVEDGETGPVPQWIGEVDITANDLLAKKAPSKKQSESLRDAETFLQKTLLSSPVAASDVLSLAARAGISEKTLRRAKSNLNVESRHLGDLAGGWCWVLPSAENAAPENTAIWPPSDETREKQQDCQESDLATFEENPEKHEDSQENTLADFTENPENIDEYREVVL